MTRHTILIVDDDFDLRDTLADVLQDHGFIVASAEDGLVALEYLRSNPAPCLILLDWMMPRCDGAQFRAEQRSDPRISMIPVVLLTADARHEEKMKAIDADAFLAKPVNLATLRAVIGRYCEA
jgi:CheY-like chemotaxis protein